VTDVQQAAEQTGAVQVVEWVEDNLGGEVVRLQRLPRWRPSWDIDVATDSGTIEIYARGERGPDFPSPFSLDHEVAVHDLFEANDVPVPHVYGLVDKGPVRTLIMDRMPGRQGLALAADDAERRALLKRCMELMVRVHHIGMDEVARRGFHVPTDASEIAMSDVFRNVESAYLASRRRDPLIEFLRIWLQRNIPAHRTRPAFVTWDSCQFLHHQGELTALIDFELAHVGDPYMDLAAMRTRDSMEPLGDLGLAFDTYAREDGEPIDFGVLRYYEISQLTVTLMLQFPVLVEPDPESDYVTHQIWYVDSARYALDIMAEAYSVDLEPVELPEDRPSSHHPAYRHLVRSLRTAARPEPKSDLTRYGIAVDDKVASTPAPDEAADPFAGWRARCDYRLARHLLRVDEIGAEVAEHELDDAARLLGQKYEDLAQADAALAFFAQSAGPERDVELLRLFARRAQRTHMLLGPADSLIVRHPQLQPLPDRAL
jgi:aminoglycoside phosphotransferase (APT) family kinase protein